jgi:hypothetical protein
VISVIILKILSQSQFFKPKLRPKMSSSERKVQPRIRRATPADKDAWVNAILTGFDLDQQFTWRYPYRKEYPDDAKKATGDVVMGLVDDGHSICWLAELPDEKGDLVVVGEAVWAWKDWSEVQNEGG